MRLRGRFTLWFGLAALVPIAAAGLLSRELVGRHHRAEQQRQRAELEQTARASLERTAAELARAADVLVTRRGLLLEDPEAASAADAPALAALAGLDVLSVVDDKGRELHVAPVGVQLLDAAAELATHGKQAHPVWIRSPRGGRTLVLATSRTVQLAGRTLRLVVGRELGEALARDVARGGADARIVDATGRPLVATTRQWTGESVVRIPLGDAVLELAPGRSRARGILEDVTLASVALGVVALLAALLLGYLVSRRISGALDRVVAGAEAITAGELDHRVDVDTRDEIGDLARSFNAMTEDLQDSKTQLVRAERIAAWEDVAKRIAHEIKNPLTPIKMSVETMRRCHDKQHPAFDEVFRESTSTVLEEVRRLERIVSEFSRFARMPRPRLAASNLNDIVTSATSLYKGSVPVHQSLSPSLPGVMADADQLTQVIVNLMENARDATSGTDAAQVTVRTSAADGGVLLEVEDNGPGIDPEVADKLFTPYVTTKIKGTGLGLAIAHRIVTEHEGTITAGPLHPAGTRFTVWLPAAQSVGSGCDRPGGEPKVALPPKVRGSGRPPQSS